MTDRIIAESTAEATINAPLDSIDLTDWVFTITDGEYQACSKDHLAAASTLTLEGKRMSINVERVGNLMVQHYVEDIAERSHVRLVSLSDSIGPDIGARTKIVVIWEFTAEAGDAGKTRFTNRVEVRTAPGYLEALEERGVPFTAASAGAQRALDAHNGDETPGFARDIERKAGAGRWG
ncbi:hypothetical protein ACFV5G_01935 [Streptomyces sp. NPDC059766]|uniref:hypothetical protein n=1 Tax=Streptomyces sp. NPDC059766 TaxID=3346940 RepID=UPI00364BCD56